MLLLSAWLVLGSGTARAISFTNGPTDPLFSDGRLSTSWNGTVAVETLYLAESLTVGNKGNDLVSTMPSSLKAMLTAAYTKYKPDLQKQLLAMAQKLAGSTSVQGATLTIQGPSFALGNPQVVGFTDTGKQQFGMVVRIPHNTIAGTLNFPASWCAAALGIAVIGLAGPAGLASLLACESPSMTVYADVELGFVIGVQNNSFVLSRAVARVFNVNVVPGNLTASVALALLNAFKGGLYVDESIGMPGEVSNQLAPFTAALSNGFKALQGTLYLSADGIADIHFTIVRTACLVPGNQSFAMACDQNLYAGNLFCVPPSAATTCLAAGWCAPATFPVAGPGNGQSPARLNNGPNSKPVCGNPNCGQTPTPPQRVADQTGRWLTGLEVSCNCSESLTGPQCCALEGGTWNATYKNCLITPVCAPSDAECNCMNRGGTWFWNAATSACQNCAWGTQCGCQGYGGTWNAAKSTCTGAKCPPNEAGTPPNCKYIKTGSGDSI